MTLTATAPTATHHPSARLRIAKPSQLVPIAAATVTAAAHGAPTATYSRPITGPHTTSAESPAPMGAQPMPRGAAIGLASSDGTTQRYAAPGRSVANAVPIPAPTMKPPNV